MKPPTDEQIEAWLKERAALTNPVDRIVWDNVWVNGLPRGLWVIERIEQEKRKP